MESFDKDKKSLEDLLKFFDGFEKNKPLFLSGLLIIYAVATILLYNEPLQPRTRIVITTAGLALCSLLFLISYFVKKPGSGLIYSITSLICGLTFMLFNPIVDAKNDPTMFFAFIFIISALLEANTYSFIKPDTIIFDIAAFGLMVVLFVVRYVYLFNDLRANIELINAIFILFMLCFGITILFWNSSKRSIKRHIYQEMCIQFFNQLNKDEDNFIPGTQPLESYGFMLNNEERAAIKNNIITKKAIKREAEIYNKQKNELYLTNYALKQHLNDLPININLNKDVESVIQLLKLHKDILSYCIIKLNPYPGALWIFAVPHEIHFILNSLIIFSVKNMLSGGISNQGNLHTLTITTLAGEKNKIKVILSDTSPHFSFVDKKGRVKINKIFVKPEDKKNDFNFIGMDYIKSFMEGIKGSIEVVNNSGTGVCYTLTFEKTKFKITSNDINRYSMEEMGKAPLPVVDKDEENIKE